MVSHLFTLKLGGKILFTPTSRNPLSWDENTCYINKITNTGSNGIKYTSYLAIATSNKSSGE